MQVQQVPHGVHQPPLRPDPSGSGFYTGGAGMFESAEMGVAGQVPRTAAEYPWPPAQMSQLQMSQLQMSQSQMSQAQKMDGRHLSSLADHRWGGVPAISAAVAAEASHPQAHLRVPSMAPRTETAIDLSLPEPCDDRAALNSLHQTDGAIPSLNSWLAATARGLNDFDVDSWPANLFDDEIAHDTSLGGGLKQPFGAMPAGYRPRRAP